MDQSCLQEAAILSQMNHPNIIKFYNYFETEDNKFCYIMDFMKNGKYIENIASNICFLGCLLDYIKKNPSKIGQEGFVIKVLSQILKALDYAKK